MARYNQTQIQGSAIPSISPVRTEAKKDIDLLSKDIEKLIGGSQQINQSAYQASEYATTLAALDTDYNTKKGFEEIYNQTVGAKLSKGEQPTSSDYKNMIDWRNKYFRDVSSKVLSDDDNQNAIYKEKFYKPSLDALDKANKSDMAMYQNLFKIEKNEEVNKEIADAPMSMTIDAINAKADYLSKVGVKDANKNLWGTRAKSMINSITQIDKNVILNHIKNGTLNELLDKEWNGYIYYDKDNRLVNKDGIEDGAALALKKAWISKLSGISDDTKKATSDFNASVNTTGTILTAQEANLLSSSYEQTQLALQAGMVSNEAVTKSGMSLFNAKMFITDNAKQLLNEIAKSDSTKTIEIDGKTKTFYESSVGYSYTDATGVTQNKFISPTAKDFKGYVSATIVSQYEPLLKESKAIYTEDGVKAFDELYNITRHTGVESTLFKELKDFASNGISSSSGSEVLDRLGLFERLQVKNGYVDMSQNDVAELRKAIDNEAKNYDLNNPEENKVAGLKLSILTDMYTNVAKSNKQVTTIDNKKVIQEVFASMDTEDIANSIKGIGLIPTSFGSEYLAGGAVDYLASTSANRLEVINDKDDLMEVLQSRTVFISESVFGEENDIQASGKQFTGIVFSKDAVGRIPSSATVKRVIKQSAKNLFGIEDLDTTDSDVSYFQSPDDNNKPVTRVVINTDGVINTFLLTEQDLINGIPAKSTSRKSEQMKALEKAKKEADKKSMEQRYNTDANLDVLNLP